MKTIIRQAVEDEILHMDHEPEKAYDGLDTHLNYPKINWDNVYDRVLDLLEDQVEIDSVPEGIIADVIEKSMDMVEDANWLQNALYDAREDYHHEKQASRNPYRHNGVTQRDFI